MGRNKGCGQSAETRKKISETLKRKYADGSRQVGKGMSGQTHSAETRDKMRASAQLRMKNNPDTRPWLHNIGRIKQGARYEAIHAWVNKYVIEKVACEFCGSKENLDAANKSGEYRRDADDWMVLCRSCHMRHDKKFGIHKPEKWRN